MRHQQLLQQHQHRHRREIALRVERQLLVEVRVDGEGGIRGHEDGVAVGRALRHGVGGDDGIGARLVLHQHRLAPGLRQPLGDLARHDVDAPARGIGDDDAHRLGGPGLRVRGGGETGEQGEQQADGFHGALMIS
jgi:hypothetical protein